MPNLYRSREDSIPDDDVKTQLQTLGSQTAPGPLLVPGNTSFLRAAYVTVTTSNEGADSYAAMIRLEGPGIDRGVFNLAIGAGGTAVATGGATLTVAKRVPINIKVREGQEILIFGEMLGGDMGTSELGVTLEFGSEAGPEGETIGEITVEGELTAVDTKTQFTTQGSVAAPSRLTPPDAKMLKRVHYAFAADDAADGEVSVFLRLGGDAIRGGEQTFMLGSAGFIDVQSGGDPGVEAMHVATLDNLDLEITPNETLDIALEMSGVDIGTVTAVVTCIFQ